MENKEYPFYQSSGDATITHLIWGEDGRTLVPGDTVNIQDEIDKAAKGMTLGEQLFRLATGDFSVLKDGEPFYGDVTGLPKTDGALIMEGQKAAQKGAEDYINQLNELKGKIDKLEDGEKKAAALEAYNTAYAKMQEIIGKE